MGPLVAAPRWRLDTDSLKIESRVPESVLAALAAAGHQIELAPPMTSMMGHAGALVRLPDGGFEGATDPRSDGAALAY